MKYFVRVLFILALFCGVATHARAQRGVDFHVQVLDPNVCISDPSICVVLDTSASLNVSLDALACQIAGVPNLPSTPGTYGCAILFNLVLPPQDITSLNLTFSGLTGLTFECDTTGDGGVGSIFSSSSCGQSGPDSDTFSFFDGSLPFLGEAVIYENGVDPSNFVGGTAAVNQPPFVPTPEPASLLLLSTGAMMAGLYFVKQRRQFAFTRK